MRSMHVIAAALLATTGAGAVAEEGRWNQADAHYDPQAMAAARRAVQDGAGGQQSLYLQSDRLEYQSGEGEPVLLWDLQGWYGGDINKLWVKTEGEHLLDDNETEEAELQALYSRAITPYFDLQAGLRHDVEPGPATTHAVLGLQGLAPYWFEVDAAAFLSEDGDVTARIEAEYEILLTQRLVLQPRAELALAAQDVEDRGVGAGFSSADLGLRLRWELDPQFAPYIGVSWSRAFGETGDLAQAAGEERERLSFVAGLRLWW